MQPNLPPVEPKEKIDSIAMAVFAIIFSIIAGSALAVIGGLWAGAFMKAFRCVYP